MVWIHGGGFVSGSGTLPIYAGDTFARDGDLVVVSISYRIGALGYLCVGAEEECGNFWPTDQLAALRWVRENIAAFGGDPDDVTVAGQSGGAFSTAAPAVHPEGRGLFRRAILQSPPFGVATPDRAQSLRTTAALLDVAGVADIAQLRALPWERLVEATIAMFGVQARWGRWPVPFVPLIDGSTMTRHALAALIDGAADRAEADRRGMESRTSCWAGRPTRPASRSAPTTCTRTPPPTRSRRASPSRSAREPARRTRATMRFAATSTAGTDPVGAAKRGLYGDGAGDGGG
ncbi:carboxylesterase family protein [Embleya scabrispora]|uniref:carboxylesterase family protein n=1 Tax=Embleya scabrispora TaxID=159449 RepID=UPI002AA51610